MFVLDLDDTLCNTTRDLRGNRLRHAFLTLVPGAIEFLRKHGRKSVLLTAGDALDQNSKIDLLRIRDYFKEESIIVVEKPEDKPAVLEKLVERFRASWLTRLLGEPQIIVIGDRLDIEIRKANELKCLTIRIEIPGGRHSGKLSHSPLDAADYKAHDFYDVLRIVGR